MVKINPSLVETGRQPGDRGGQFSLETLIPIVFSTAIEGDLMGTYIFHAFVKKDLF